jgi:hypothetical protein
MNDTIIAKQASQIADLERRLQRLEDIEAIKVLQRTYGYFVDKALWSDLAELFSQDGEIEIGGRGVYKGLDRIRVFLRDVMGKGHDGLNHGQLMNHMQLQGIVTLDESGETALGRVYENAYVRENGTWKISRLTWFATYYTPYEKGFGQETLPLTTMSESFPPDRPPTFTYAALPDVFIPPFHYPHPVTGDKIGRNVKQG